MDDQNQYFIELKGEIREDGSVFVCSPDLPLFSVIGASEQDAFNNAMKILPEYLRANVPDFVELRAVSRAGQLFSPKHASALPAHVIATLNKSGDHAAGRT